MRKVAVRLASSVARQRSRLIRATGTSSGSQVPALATHASRRPSASTASGTSASAAASSRRSACSATPPICAASASAASALEW